MVLLELAVAVIFGSVNLLKGPGGGREYAEVDVKDDILGTKGDLGVLVC